MLYPGWLDRWLLGLALLLAGVRVSGALAGPAASGVPEPAAPAATAAVQRLLEPGRAAGAGQAEEALRGLERALSAAREAGDRAGEARALRERALLLTRMEREAEAITAWESAAGAWERVGDGPGQVEALAIGGVLRVGGAPAEGEALIAKAVGLARAEQRRPRAAADALHLGGLHAYLRRRVPQARALWEAAVAVREPHAPRSAEQAGSLNGLGILAQMRGDLDAAEQYHRRALALHEALEPGSMDVASSLGNLGILAQQRGDLAGALRYQERALAIQAKQAPGSLLLANSLGNIGNLAYQQGDLPLARKYFERALAIQAKRSPGSLEVAGSLNNLGVVTQWQGDLVAAIRYYRRAMGVITKRAPRSPDAADSLGNLANVAMEQGNLAAAREVYERVLAIQAELAPDSLTVALTLSNLGGLAYDQGDLEAAREYYRRALTVQQQQAPESLAVASSLHNLGNVVYSDGDTAAARRYYERSLALYEKLAPGSVEAANSLSNLGSVSFRQGDRAAARGYYQQALAIRQKLAPGSLAVADSLWNLGTVAQAEGRLASARVQYRQALVIQQKLAPQSLAVAKSLNNLAAIAARQNRWPEAERHVRRAWALVRGQAAAVSGDEARQAFGTATGEYAANLVRAQLALGKAGAAFQTVEESRAQALLQILAERGLPTGRASPGLRSAYRAAVAGRDRAERNLFQVSISATEARRAVATAQEQKATPEELSRQRTALEAAARLTEAAQADYTRARLVADRLWARIRQQAPRAASGPVSPAQARRALPAGTVFAAFLVGEEQTFLFLLHGGSRGPAALAVYPLSIPLPRLRERVEALAALAGERLGDPSATTTASRALFAALFPPASQPVLRQARRLLVSPDGPLWQVPFAALVTNRQGAPRFLGIEKPLAYTQSLTLFAQARTRAPIGGGGRRTLVLGDPVFDRRPTQVASAPDLSLSRGGERGFLLRGGRPPAPLPATRREAETIARVYGGQPLLGEQAEERRVRQRIGSADVVHLATHGAIHPVRAMSSGLLLTAPVREPEIGETGNDGVLQAWEIYSQLRLRAELVVLSACETGRGRTVQGEGIVGLTRALQVAGARSVVASQWAVADEHTARLMVAFHQKLRLGLAKDEALRQAMAGLQRSPGTSPPYYWAAFCLIGDPDSRGAGARRGGGPAVRRGQRGR